MTTKTNQPEIRRCKKCLSPIKIVGGNLSHGPQVTICPKCWTRYKVIRGDLIEDPNDNGPHNQSQ